MFYLVSFPLPPHSESEATMKNIQEPLLQYRRIPFFLMLNGFFDGIVRFLGSKIRKRYRTEYHVPMITKLGIFFFSFFQQHRKEILRNMVMCNMQLLALPETRRCFNSQRQCRKNICACKATVGDSLPPQLDRLVLNFLTSRPPLICGIICILSTLSLIIPC